MTMPIVVMGVSGCGKTSVGALLASELGRPFLDADDLHAPAAVDKMAAGIPLDDEDRRPWLDRVGARLADDERLVVACSALKRSYRDRLRSAARDVYFLHLTGTPVLLRRRTMTRSGHFMPPSLLESQLAALDPLGADERGAVIDVGDPLPAVAARARVAITTLNRRTLPSPVG